MTRLARPLLLVNGVASVVWASVTGVGVPYPALRVVENVLLTTAKDDFGGRAESYRAAASWSEERLRFSNRRARDVADDGSQRVSRAPYLACTDYMHGRRTLSQLQSLLSPKSVRRVSSSKEHGACFFATASHDEAARILGRDSLELTGFSPFPSALKIAPGLLEYSTSNDEKYHEARSKEGVDRLAARHGPLMRKDNAVGLFVELSPGTLRSSSDDSTSFIADMVDDLMSESLDLHASNFWSDPATAEGEHLADPQGTMIGRAWTKAATVVHRLSEAAGTTPADICSWDGVIFHQSGNDVLVVAGLDHLMYNGRGSGGSEDGEAAELHAACLMGFVSFLASKPEVLRISPRHAQRALNAVASAIVQSATETDTPLTDVGLDGTGEIIQVIDTGLDETSCFFIDDDGEKVDHGYYFDELGLGFVSGRSSQSTWINSISEPDFSIYPERRKIVQYIDLVNPDSPFSGITPTANGGSIYLIPAEGFGEDDPAGHGTHTAGSAAGATLYTPAETATCLSSQTLSCVGACLDDGDFTDDLVTSAQEIVDLDRACPLFGCYEEDNPQCLDEDVSATLTANGGVAQGAKLAIFDTFFEDMGLSDFVGNDLWEPCLEEGCRIHSNSLGADSECVVSSTDLLYDQFMYENQENLLIFAAGNDGDLDRSACTIASPAIGKNALAVGATTSGETRVVTTVNADGIDTVASFSGWGFTTDGRIKPEVVAPGDMVYSAASDGSDEHSCRLWAFAGTSMSCPVVAGSSAMIRQYFTDDSYYVADVTARGFCNDFFLCEAFSPSAATVKAMLINSANLMGGSSEPDGFRGFGRVHLEAGMPVDGEDNLVLFVADSSTTEVDGNTYDEYLFDVDADAGLDFRVTLSWIDKPASSFSSSQLVHDLDLYVVSPSGISYTMWGSGDLDGANVNERVIVDADEVETGTWTVWVWANVLDTDTQSYSLIATGALSEGTGEAASIGTSSDPSFPFVVGENSGASAGWFVSPVALLSRVVAAAAAAAAATTFYFEA